MRKSNKLLIAAVLALAVPSAALASDVDLQVRIDKLTKQMDELKGQVQRMEDKQLGKWLTIGGLYQFRIDSLKATAERYNQVGFNVNGTLNFSSVTPVPAHTIKDNSLMTNKFQLDLKAQATKDVTVTASLNMYKTFGSQNDAAVNGGYYADRTGVFDGTLGHVPSGSELNVDRVYATWNNIAGQPIWFSVGRRPSTDGAPLNFKSNTEKPGTGGTPALLVNYAFDGMTLGYAPDIDSLPGAYAKVCYGRGYDSGFNYSQYGAYNGLKDTDMLGFAIVPIDTDPLRVWMQYNRAFNIFDAPTMTTPSGASYSPSTNLGDIDWYGIGAMSTIKSVGPGNLNIFADFGVSVTHPDSYSRMYQAMSANQFNMSILSTGNLDSKTGTAYYLGARYDLPSKTKVGFEFNHGSKNWITFAPSADDMWTSKVGTRGNVYEPYIIQELDLKPVSSRLSKAFFKLGYQYYDFNYTGSNDWVGAPVSISDASNALMQIKAPISKAQDVYATFTVQF